MKNIILTGFMGTGKTSAGRGLARELNLKFIDTDDLIEKEAGICIKEIFTKFGEEYFRRLESKIIHEVSSDENMIIATGGGAVVNPENLLALKKNGVLICLTASLDVIISRVGSGDERPLISEGDMKDTISSLLNAREPFYKKADFIVDTSTKSIKEVVKEILKIVETSLSPLP